MSVTVPASLQRSRHHATLTDLAATRCGFIGCSSLVSTLRHASRHSSYLRWVRSRKLRSCLLFQHEEQLRRVLRLSPTNPISTGYRKPIRPGSRSICTPRAWPGFGRMFDIREKRCRPSGEHRSSASSLPSRLYPEAHTEPVVYGLSSGIAAFPKTAFAIGAPSSSAIPMTIVARAQCSSTNQHRRLSMRCSGSLPLSTRSTRPATRAPREDIGRVMQDVVLRSRISASPLPGDLRERSMRDTP